MKPNPLASLNRFTVPCSIVFSSVLICCHAQSNWGSGRRIFAETELVPMQGVCILAPNYVLIASRGGPAEGSAPTSDRSHLESIRQFSDGDARLGRHMPIE